MHKVAQTLAALVLLFHLAFGSAESAQNASGTWSIAPSDGTRHVELSLRADDARTGSIHHNTFEIDPATLGLTTAQLAAKNAAVRFTLAREAGTFLCTGTLNDGSGGGPLTFTPSDAFADRMRSRGYNLTLDHLLEAASVDLTTDYVDGIAAAGYAHIEYANLIAFRATGVDPDYVRAIRQALAPNTLNSEQLIPLHALHVDAEYLRGLASVGYAQLEPSQAIQLRALGIDAAYIRRVQAHGLAHPSIEKLVELKAMNLVFTDRDGRA
jgi:hypothetical protein